MIKQVYCNAVVLTCDSDGQLRLHKILSKPQNILNTLFLNLFQVKLQYLHYLHQLIHQMEMSEFINNADTRGAVSKIITWVEEPKSGDIRTAAKSVIVSMFNLNPPEFSALITGLQKTFQVGLSVMCVFIHRCTLDSQPFSYSTLGMDYH